MEEEPEPQCVIDAPGQFETYDANDSGNLDWYEMQMIHHLLFEDTSTYTITGLMMKYDEDDDHLISLEEFTELWCNEEHSEEPNSNGDAGEALDVFNEFDVDHNQQICGPELSIIYYLYCDNCGYSMIDLQVAYDENEDSCLCLPEFREMYCYLTGICPEGEELVAEEIFNQFDLNKDGVLSPQEYAIVHYLHCQECSQSMVEAFNTYDENSDNTLVLGELKHLFCEVLGYCGCVDESDICPE
jgi:Ca2+-binding EF-hand superfamily protein